MLLGVVTGPSQLLAGWLPPTLFSLDVLLIAVVAIREFRRWRRRRVALERYYDGEIPLSEVPPA